MRSAGARLRRWAIPVLVSGTLLWLVLRRLSAAELAAAWSKTSSTGLAAAAGLLVVSYCLRSWRWTMPLESPLGVTTAIGAIGLAANHFLPARGGEAIRSWLLRRHFEVPMTKSLAVIFGERLCDALVLAGLAGLASLSLEGIPEWLTKAAAFGGAASLGGAVLFAASPWIHSRLPAKADRLKPAVEAVKALGRPLVLAGFFAATAAIWLLDALAGRIISTAMGLPLSYPVQLLLLAALAFSGAVPAAPGGAGVYQFVAVELLRPFGVDANPAVVFLLIFQAIDYAVAGAAGMAGYAALPAKLRDISQWRSAGRAT